MPARTVQRIVLISLAVVAGAACSAVSPSESGAALRTPEGITWEATAVELRSEPDGAQFTYNCTADGEVGAVWGTDIYTDDSSICTAAVHAGLITLPDGGDVTIELRPGEGSYTDSTRNGITSLSYAAWDWSYVFVTD